MKSSIATKLQVLLNKGIESEAEVVYLMSAVRKLLEQQSANGQYPHLKFHCDWSLHSSMDKGAAQKILGKFDAANVHLKAGIELDQLPSDLRREIQDISKMHYFKEELADFLQANELPAISTARSDGWVYFLHLYAMVVEDCPLVISKADNTAGIETVTVHLELGKKPMGDNMPYRVTWTVLDKNGMSGDLFVLNTFSLKPQSD